uniref:Uncharacterized protein n=1 Tax=Steinernema glaseri TaxID=37863 RepID=A0A1I7YIF8_9BILA
MGRGGRPAEDRKGNAVGRIHNFVRGSSVHFRTPTKVDSKWRLSKADLQWTLAPRSTPSYANQIDAGAACDCSSDGRMLRRDRGRFLSFVTTKQC